MECYCIFGESWIFASFGRNSNPQEYVLTNNKSKSKLELVYLPYCVYPRMVYRLAIVMPPPPPPFRAISDQYATFIFLNLFTKWLPAAILDDRKSLLIAFLAISDQYATFFIFTKWLPAAILDDRKSLSNAFLAISDQYTTLF